jgi:molybdopterin-guanine dinucleotide biosynthesis protein B
MAKGILNMNKPPVLGICAQSSGMGKTTLLEKLLPALATRGIRVSVIKQTCAEFDIDRPGKDSHRLRQAGAAQVLLSSPQRWVLMSEQATDHSDDRLMPLIRHLDGSKIDLVLVEGFRHAPIHKIEVYRAGTDASLLAWHDPRVIAVASDIFLAAPVPLLDLNDAAAVAAHIVQWMAPARGIEKTRAEQTGKTATEFQADACCSACSA